MLRPSLVNGCKTYCVMKNYTRFWSHFVSLVSHSHPSCAAYYERASLHEEPDADMSAPFHANPLTRVRNCWKKRRDSLTATMTEDAEVRVFACQICSQTCNRLLLITDLVFGKEALCQLPAHNVKKQWWQIHGSRERKHTRLCVEPAVITGCLKFITGK